MDRTEFVAPYAGIPSFFKAPVVDPKGIEEGMAVVAGIPMDHGVVLTRTGTRYGPRAIREASLFYRAVQEAGVEQTAVNVDTKVAQRLKERPNLVDMGDLTVYPQDIMKTTESISAWVNEIVQRGALPVLLGGDHYLTYPAFEGFAQGIAERKPGARLGHVHIDSHTDFRDAYAGLGRYNHGTCVRRLSENPMIDYANMAWVGLNGSILDADTYRIYRSHGLRMISANNIRERGIREAIEEAVEAAADGSDAVYVSIDIDVVDSAYAPGTGVPVFEGITARDFSMRWKRSAATISLEPSTSAKCLRHSIHPVGPPIWRPTDWWRSSADTCLTRSILGRGRFAQQSHEASPARTRTAVWSSDGVGARHAVPLP